MAKIKQFTIAVENRPGAVATIAKVLGSAKVNILALSGTGQGTAGALQIIAEDARRAKKALDEAGLTYAETTGTSVRTAEQARCVSGIFREAFD